MEAEEMTKIFPRMFPEIVKMMCGPGWEKLIHEACSKINKEIEDHDHNYPPYCSQIKEEFGELRIHMGYTTDKIQEIIQEATELSRKTCEGCGIPVKGSTVQGKWIFTLCDSCKEIRKGVKWNHGTTEILPLDTG